MSSNLSRYENQVRNTRDVDIDGDGKVDGLPTGRAPIYALDLSKPSSVLTWGRATVAMFWWQFWAFSAFCLFGWFVLRPMALTAPVALFRNNPKILTEREAGSEIGAWTNNTLVGLRGLAGTTLEATQEAQIKQNSANGDRRPAENLVPKAKVQFVDN
jgi:hypothetical protein